MFAQPGAPRHYPTAEPLRDGTTGSPCLPRAFSALGKLQPLHNGTTGCLDTASAALGGLVPHLALHRYVQVSHPDVRETYAKLVPTLYPCSVPRNTPPRRGTQHPTILKHSH
jgi:hypothetical protein